VLIISILPLLLEIWGFKSPHPPAARDLPRRGHSWQNYFIMAKEIIFLTFDEIKTIAETSTATFRDFEFDFIRRYLNQSKKVLNRLCKELNIYPGAVYNVETYVMMHICGFTDYSEYELYEYCSYNM
jgi:hypothetical protein